MAAPDALAAPSNDYQLWAISAHLPDQFHAVTWSPDGRLIATGSSDCCVRVWDAASGKLLRTLEGHTAAVESVSFSPDGKVLASGAHDSSVRLWDAASGKLLRTLKGPLRTKLRPDAIRRA